MLLGRGWGLKSQKQKWEPKETKTEKGVQMRELHCWTGCSLAGCDQHSSLLTVSPEWGIKPLLPATAHQGEKGGAVHLQAPYTRHLPLPKLQLLHTPGGDPWLSRPHWGAGSASLWKSTLPVEALRTSVVVAAATAAWAVQVNASLHWVSSSQEARQVTKIQSRRPTWPNQSSGWHIN